MTTDKLEVAQSDREAAAAYLWQQGGHDIDAKVIWSGCGDHKDLVQAFARHRLAERERCAALAEMIVGDRDGVPERIRIATAIRSTSHAE